MTSARRAGSTALLDAERALAAEREHLRAVILHAPAPMALHVGPEHRFELVNDAYRQISGGGRDVTGLTARAAFPELEDQSIFDAMDRVYTTGEPLIVPELAARYDRDGSGVQDAWFNLRLEPIRDADGRVFGILNFSFDITEQVRARHASERARSELAEANSLLQEQQLELELANQQLQDSTVELETQAEELQATAAHLEERTEEAEAARGTLAALVEAVTDGFVALDRDLRFTYVNRRAAEMWAHSAAALLGRTPNDIWPEMDHSPFVALLQRVIASGSPEVLEGYSSSLRMPIEMRAYPSAGGGLVAFFADLTEHRRAEEAATFIAEASRVLASSADYQITLTNLAKAAVPRLADWCAVDVLTEPDSTEWPPTIERAAVVHEDPAKLVLAQTLTTTFPQDWSRETGTPGVIRSGQPMFLPDVTDAMLVGGARNEEHLAMLRQLQFRSLMIVPLVARGRVRGTITLVMAESQRVFTDADLALAVDLGRRAGMSLDTTRLLRDAEEANATKTEFLRTVSHELRQPLNAIRGYIDLWQAGLRGELPAAMRDDVDRLSRNQEHLTALIEDLLSFTRLDAGRLEVDHVAVPIGSVFDALESMVRPQMDAREIAFSFNSCAPDLAATGDRDRIVQVCLNLLTNAMRATAAGGRVTLSCVADPEIITVQVSDTGRGIPPDKLEAIFDPFTQVGRALNAPKEGAGLGLAISRGLAEAMGGSLSVESVLGEGSMFALHLPRYIKSGL